MHDIGTHLPLTSGDKVYIAEGAIVEGAFAIEHATNVTIRGRGILHGGNFAHRESFAVIKGRDTADVLIEGITICNAPGWMVSFWEGSRNLTVRNVKMVGNFRYNTDGVQTGTDGLLVEDCFLQCNDDNFSLNGVCKNVEIRNNVLWNLYNGGVFMMGWATGEHFDLENLDIHDNVILRAGGCCDYDPKGPISMKLFGSHRKARDIRFSNLVIEDIAAYGRWIDLQAGKASRSQIGDMRFENIDVLDAWHVAGEISGMGPDNPIENVSFENITILGEPMTDPGIGGLNLVNTENVTIEGAAFTNAVVSIIPRQQQQTAGGGGGSAQPTDIFAGLSSSLLPNARFEEAMGGWAPHNPDRCRVMVDDAVTYDDTPVVTVTDRQAGGTGLEVDITDLLLENGPGDYTYAAAVQAVTGTVSVKVTIAIEDDAGKQMHPSPDFNADAGGWTRAGRRTPLNWSDLKRALFIVESGWDDKGPFRVGEAWLTR